MNIQIKRLSLADVDAIKPIHSAEEDLNDFLRDDAVAHLIDAQGVTYVMENENETICYCTILHDKLSLQDSDNKQWNKVTRQIQRYRRDSYPAVKIGKLATGVKYEHKGYARRMISLVQGLYTINPQMAGCRFITVDALNKPNPKTGKSAVDFYKDLGFILLTDKDANEETRYMAFDLQKMLKSKSN